MHCKNAGMQIPNPSYVTSCVRIHVQVNHQFVQTLAAHMMKTTQNNKGKHTSTPARRSSPVQVSHPLQTLPANMPKPNTKE